MPQVVPLLAPIVGAISSAATAFGAGISAFAATGIGGFLLSAGAAFGLSYLSGLLRPSSQTPQPRPQDQQVTIKSSSAPRFRGYGIVKIGGVLMHAGAQGGYLHRIFALGSGEIDAFLEHWIDDLAVEIDGSGDVTSGKYVHEGQSRVHIESRLGTTSPAQYTGITDWTADHLGKGIPSAYVRLEQVPSEVFLDTFPNGGNTQYRAVYRGAKVPNPTIGATGVTDGGNFSWSDNAARVICDYLIHPDGLGLDPSWITNALSYWQTAQSICDEDVALAAGGTEKRYRIWNTYRFDERPADVLQRFLAACDGILVATPGRGLALIVGKWVTPTVTIDDSAILSFEDIGRGRDALTTANTIRAQFTFPGLDYQATDADPWIDDADVTARGEFVTDIALFPVPSHGQARRLMKISAHRANPEWVGTLTCNLRALPVMGERFITVQVSELGISGTFEILDQPQFLVDEESRVQGMQISVASLTSAAYAWNAATEEGTGPVVPTFTAPDNTIDAPTGLDVTISQRATVDGGTGAFAVLDWDAPSADYFRGEARFKKTSDSFWISIGVLRGASQTETGILEDGAEYEFQIRTISVSGRVSAWSDSVTRTIVADDAAPSAPTNPGGTGGELEATLTCTAPNSRNFKAAILYRSSSNVFALAVQVETVNGSPNQAISYRHQPILSGTWYYWWTASNASGVESAPTTSVSVVVSDP
ncbi:fibronectin type III domain-containing protein [Amorphus sp. MBR-141]